MQILPEVTPQLSVVLITLNEQARIARCLAALPNGAELIVVDSGSTDDTCRIAQSMGARVVTRAFTDYSDQKNAALDLATRPWILSLDADEVLDQAARAALVNVTAQLAGPAAYRLKRRLVFLGRPLRFGKAVDRPVRLIKRGSGRFSASIHERLEVAGVVERLPGEVLHYSYRDLTDYFARFNDYTSKIALNHERHHRAMPPALMHWLRPWGEFFYRYIVRLGCLDGYEGYTYALVSSMYTFVKYGKLRERQQLSGKL